MHMRLRALSTLHAPSCVHACMRAQKINHFNGMLEICRKRAMARNLQKMARIFPEHFAFFPMTFVLPSDTQV